MQLKKGNKTNTSTIISKVAITMVALMANAVLFSACTEGKKKVNSNVIEVSTYDNSRLEAVPFKDSIDTNKWGLISLEGNVVVKPQFEKEPSNIVNGVFTVKNSDGYCEYYIAGDEPKKIGGEYSMAGLFYEDIAPCIEKGTHYIQFIKKDGTIALKLDSVDGKKVESVSRFWNGYATFKADGMYGYIDKTGKKVIDAKFLKGGYFSNEQIALVVDTANGNKKKFAKDEDYKIRIVDNKGNFLKTEFAKSDSVGKMFSMGVLQCAEMAEDSSGYIRKFVDRDGNVIIPAGKKYQIVSDMQGTHFAYYNGEFWGIADNQTTDIIDPTLDEVIYTGLASAAIKKYGIYKLVDYSGEPISRSYSTMRYLKNGNNFIVSKDKRYWIIDSNGNELTIPLIMIDFNEPVEIISLN